MRDESAGAVPVPVTAESEPIDLQEGPQRIAGESEARVIFYGGAKGGGKSRWGVHESAKWYDIPNRSAHIFRRTYPELTGAGSLWDETMRLYPLLGGEPVESKLMWRFPSGFHCKLSHLQHEKDAERWNGKNIGDVFLDELTHFTERQFWILLSCMRSTAAGDPPKLRASMNPDPDSWVLQFVSWYLDDAGFPIPERSGVIRWFGRIDGRLVWFGSEAEAHAGGVDMPMSFTFIAANVWDNPALLNARPEYLAQLKALPPVDQARFLGGNWKIRRTVGDYFREGWFPVRSDSLMDQLARLHPTDDDIIRVIRIWDLAATPHLGDTVDPLTPAPDDNDPDWTRGLKCGLCRDGRLVLLDLASCRDSPGPVEEFIIQTALIDGPHVEVIIPLDPAQAGKYQAEALTKAIRRRGRVRQVHARPPTESKETYASIAGRSAYAKRILVQHAPWNEAFFKELEHFPAGRPGSGIPRKPGMHYDCVDVLSGAVLFALDHPVGGKLERPAENGPLPSGLQNDMRTLGDLRVL